MGWDGAGNYVRTHNFSADGSAGIKILASRMDAELNDMASAISLTLTRNGQNEPNANLPMGGFRHVNVGAPTSARNYIRVQDVINNVPIYMVDTEASADRISVSAVYFTTASAAAGPADGTKIIVKVGSDKTSAVALYLNAGYGTAHSANVVLANNSGIYSGAIYSGAIYEFLYNSTDNAWQILNPSIILANTDTAGVIEIATTAEVDTGTDTTKAITPALLTHHFSADHATETSVGLIEVATTAEGSAGTNISAAMTPAVTRAVLYPYTPYAMVAAITSAASGSVLSRNTFASAWTFSSGGAGIYNVVHNLGLASAGELVISIQAHRENGARNVIVPIFSVSASTFSLTLVNTSGSAEIVSTNLHIIAYRVS